MTFYSKKTAASAMIAAAGAMLAGCGGQGPNTYLMPKNAVKAKLTGAEREYSYIGGQHRDVSAISWNGDTLRVRVGGANMRSMTCSAVVEAVDEDWTRVIPDCPNGRNAEQQVESEIAAMQVDEFVIAVLYDKPVDESMVAKRTSAVVIDNIDEITREVHEEVEAAANAQPSYSSSDWASEDGSSSDWGSN